MKRMILAAALAGVTIFISANVARAADGDSARRTVVELFTSQGCSSCPPADALLRRLSKRPDIIALSIHVNYWDYIGWKDPFATDESTGRQHLYADALRQRYVYTPEMVIDGYKDITGSDESGVMDLIKEAQARDRERLAVTAAPGGPGKIEVSIPAGKAEGKATVWLFALDSEHVTKVARGENGGRTLTDANVVREVKKIGVWTGEPLRITADLPADRGDDACAIVVQSGDVGPVIGATLLEIR